MKELEVPKKVERFGKLWASLYCVANKNWRQEQRDIWYSYKGYDLNLYIEDEQLTMSVYPLADDGTGFMTTDTSTWKTIVQFGRGA